MRTRYTAVVYRDPETGDYIGNIPALPGANTCAATLAELRSNLQEAAELVLEDMLEHGESAHNDFQLSLEPIEIAA